MHTLPHETQLHNALTRSKLYKLLAQAFQYPKKQLIDFFASSDFEDLVKSYRSVGNSRKILQPIQLLQETVLKQTVEETLKHLESEYNRLFAHLGSATCPPYETEYGFDNVFQKTDAMADIAGFYSAYALETADQNTERVDFISMELEYMSYLAANEAYARKHEETEHWEICLDTQRKFLRDHLGRWVDVFARILSKATKNEFYLCLGKLTEEFLNGEIQTLGVEVCKVTEPKQMTAKTPELFDCGSCLVSHAEKNEK